MKLPSRIMKLNAQLDELDIRITPSLGEIVDTDKFKEEKQCFFFAKKRGDFSPVLFPFFL